MQIEAHSKESGNHLTDRHTPAESFPVRRSFNRADGRSFNLVSLPKPFGHGGSGRQRILKRDLVCLAKKIGATVENDSSGNWNVLQLVAPAGFLWDEGIQCIKVEWPVGESSEPACRDAYSRISGAKFRPMTDKEREFYAEDSR